MTLVLRYAARSDRGLVRSNNEDSVYAGARLLALADGMGGHAAGEVASQLMIAALAHLDDDEPGEDLLGKLERATRDGNDAIARHVEEDPELDGMGTTLTALLFSGRKIGLVHIGDSRAYLLRDDELAQITRDDTFVQSLVDEGRITAEQAHSHPQRSLIMRALTGNEIEPTLILREARAGDRYLLCSDGLSDPVSEETIANTMREGACDECADRLIELALRSGGPDNVTVIVADVIDLDYGDSHPIVGGAASGSTDEDAPPPNTAAGRAAAIRPKQERRPKPLVVGPQEEQPRKSRLRLWIAGALALIVLAGAGTITANYLMRSNFFVGENDGHVVIKQGLPESFLGLSLTTVAEVGCLVGDDSVRLSTAGSNSCDQLRLDDLQQAGRQQVQNRLPSSSREGARDQYSRLVDEYLLPECTTGDERTGDERSAGTDPNATGLPSPTAAPTEPVPATAPAPGTEPTPPADPNAPGAAPETALAPPAPPAEATPTSTPVPQIEGTTCRATR